MRILRRISLLLALAAVLTFAALRICAVAPADLALPFSVGEVSFLADGGSMAIELVGANGKRLFASRQGSLHVESARQPMAMACTCFGIPYASDVMHGDKNERAIQGLLESWLDANSTPEDRLRFETRSNLDTVSAKALGVLEMLSWIRTRQ